MKITVPPQSFVSPTLSGTVAGAPAWASSQAITLSTAAQPNVTSLGNLTALTVSGDISLFGTTTAPVSQSGYALLAIGPNQTIQGFETLVAGSVLAISQNASQAVSNTWKYISTDVATNYYQSAGTHVFRATPSGTAGNAITWTNVLSMGIGGVSLLGTTTNDNAAAGNVGEYVSSLVAVGSPQSLSNGTAANVTSISLTAGDWDVAGHVNFLETTSTVTARSAGISSTSATLPTDGSEGYCGVQSTVTSETNTITIARKRISISSTTTIYLVGKATFSAGTCGGFGAITARRVR